MNVYILASGESRQGYTVHSVHTEHEDAVHAAHVWMDTAYGFRDMPRKKREETRMNADAFGGDCWECDGDLVYVIRRRLSKI